MKDIITVYWSIIYPKGYKPTIFQRQPVTASCTTEFLWKSGRAFADHFNVYGYYR